MNIIKIPATAVALCALCLAGCTDDAEQPEQPGVQPGQQVTMTLRADAATPDTRVSYTDNGSKMLFSWNANDQLSVYVDGVTGNENCQLKTTETGKSADFSGTVTAWEGEKTIYALYPYQSSYSITNGNDPATATTTLTLYGQYYYPTTGKNDHFYMVGTGKATASDTAIAASAAMKQVMSFVVVNMTNAPGKVKEVKLTCEEEAVFPNKATVTLSTGEIVNNTYNTKKLTLNVSNDTYEAKKSVFLALFPADLTGKKINITVTCLNGTTRTIEKDGTNFERNTHYVVDFDKDTQWDNFYPSVKRAQEILQATDATVNEPDGTNHVFEISTPEQLAALHVLITDDVPMPGAQRNQTYELATYKLTTDIDLKNNNWRPIEKLNGTFDGQGHTISGLNVSGNFSYAGLFATSTGTIKNLMVKGNVSPTGSNAGGIVGTNNGTIAFCSFEGTVSSSNMVGGICGDNTYSAARVTSCFACVEVSGGSKKGGIAGSNTYNNPTGEGYNLERIVEGCMWYYNPNASTDKGIEACYDNWRSDSYSKNASFADTDGLSARLTNMNSYIGDYKWVVGGTMLKLVQRTQP